MSDRDKCADWVDSYEVLAHWGESAAIAAEVRVALAEMMEGEG